MRVLALDTTTRAGSVAIVDGDAVVDQRCGDATRTHAARMPAEILTLLAAHERTLADVDVFAVASGPGSFTGLRIGIATIKALSTTLERPCAGIPTLDAIAHAGGASVRSVALMPAGRGEVFAQLFSVSADGT